MSDLNELYQSIILDHNRRPRNFGQLENATASALGKNPLCGDEVTVWLRVENDTIADISFRGVGCAISRAAASLMTTAVKGKTLTEVDEIFGRFHAVVTGRISASDAQAMDKPIAVFSGVAKFPVRVKCAVLAWHTLRSAIDGGGIASTEHTGPDSGAAVTGGGA